MNGVTDPHGPPESRAEAQNSQRIFIVTGMVGMYAAVPHGPVLFNCTYSIRCICSFKYILRLCLRNVTIGMFVVWYNKL